MPNRTKMAAACSWAALLVLGVALAAAAACANYRQVFLPDHLIAFVDGDCYARMTRVRAIVEQRGLSLTQHRFENYPDGTHPHTTAPFDGAILALRACLRLAGVANGSDLAGAWISPLLDVFLVAGLWAWLKRERLPGAWAVLLIVAGSPILAHGFGLGRPDHQSLIVLLMAAALAAEWSFWRQPSYAMGLVGGLAWAVGLWTSLYEPGILLILIVILGAVLNRPGLRRVERLPGLAVGALVLLLALGIEGRPVIDVPGHGQGAGAAYFTNWSRQIGELQSLLPWSPTIYQWTGLGLVAAPFVLLWPRGPDWRLARAQSILVVTVLALTCWQARWGYFLPLVYALSLPWQAEAIAPKFRPLAAALFFLGLLPMAREWRAVLWPPPPMAAVLAEQREDNVALRDTADFIARASASANPNPSLDCAGILAPWWLSPPLAYWTGQPAVAGSSHESLPGIVDVARFYVAADVPTAIRLLHRRKVRWVVAYEPERVLSTASSLLDQPLVPKRAWGAVLYQQPENAPSFLRLAFVNPAFKVYEVVPISPPAP